MPMKHTLPLIGLFAVLCACQGQPGPQGLVGPAGSPGASLSGYEIVVSESAVSAQAPKQLAVNCPTGKKSVGAGWSVLDSTSALLDGRASYFEPTFDGSGWLVNAMQSQSVGLNWKLRVRLICANAP